MEVILNAQKVEQINDSIIYSHNFLLLLHSGLLPTQHCNKVQQSATSKQKKKMTNTED